MNRDIRWLQRYDSYHRACQRVMEVTESGIAPDALSELEMEGLIQRFEYTFELAWKVLQDLLRYKGYEELAGPNPVLQKSFEDGWIADHDAWRRMSKARNVTSHTYNEGEALGIVKQIFAEYSNLLHQLDTRLMQEEEVMRTDGIID
ncbi:MAG: nucleotidyltransferase substrate binding protein [Prevotellaceae bacterium]|jgi:nucleotidyltransferase substrate binding protein (TIGR01987 family)|nr:nucleotidyltransferase substrate binding protein [Prevotellaceae bacterium]